MRRKFRIIAALLVAAVLFASAMPSAAAQGAQGAGPLRFNDDGKFTILQFADCQDDILPRRAMLRMMGEAMDVYQPDLVVFTGDNIGGGSSPGYLLTAQAIKAVTAPVAARGIPFAIVFGNHDHESNVAEEVQLSVYQSIPGCLAYDAEPGLYGCANYNLPVLSSDGSKTTFNLWFFDSNEYDPNGGYDWVRDDQVAWYTQTSDALAAQNGGKVPSLAFQHICPPETYQLLESVPVGTEGSRQRFGGNWALALNNEVAQGTILEWPCPSDTVSAQFAAFVSQGDVLGVAVGHDHVNDFVGTYHGVDIIQTPGVTYQSYGDDSVRGCRVITVDESDPWAYETHTPTFFDLFGTGPDAQFINTFEGSEFATFLPGVSDLIVGLIRFYQSLLSLF